jgi:hypothetical protein
MDRVIEKELEEVQGMEDGWEKEQRMYVVTVDLLKYVLIKGEKGEL